MDDRWRVIHSLLVSVSIKNTRFYVVKFIRYLLEIQGFVKCSSARFFILLYISKDQVRSG